MGGVLYWSVEAKLPTNVTSAIGEGGGVSDGLEQAYAALHDRFGSSSRDYDFQMGPNLKGFQTKLRSKV